MYRAFTSIYIVFTDIYKTPDMHYKHMDLGEFWQEKHEETLKGTWNSENANNLYSSVKKKKMLVAVICHRSKTARINSSPKPSQFLSVS